MSLASTTTTRRRMLGLATTSFLGVLAAACGGAPAASPTAVAPPAPPASPTAIPVPTAVPLVTAAPSPTTPPAVAPTAAPVATATPAPTTAPSAAGTNEVVVVARSDMTHMDPALASDYQTWTMLQAPFNGLVNIDQKNQIIPDLAVELPKVSSDGLKYTFTLRKGVKFHNGREMTMDDVLFSFNRAADPKTKSWGQSYLAGVLGYDDVKKGNAKTLAGLKALDPNTLEITLSQPRAVFIQELTMSTIHIVPQDVVQQLGDKWDQQPPIGTGAFKVTEYVRGQRLVLERNKDYFKSGLPYLDKVTYKLGVEPSVGLLQILKGDADFMVDVPPTAQLSDILNSDKYKNNRFIQPDLYTIALALNVEVPPLDKLEVRQAIAYALNPDKYVQALGGIAIRNNQWLPKGLPGWDSTVETIKPDPARAKDLLAKAGLASGFKTEMWLQTGRSDDETWFPIAQQDLAAVGITAEIRKVEGAALGKASQTAKTVPIFRYSWGPDFPDPYDYMTDLFGCTSVGVVNTTYWCNKEFDQTIVDAEKVVDNPQKRLDMYQKAQKQVLSQFAIVPLYQLNLVRVHSERFKGLVVHPIYREEWEHSKLSG